MFEILTWNDEQIQRQPQLSGQQGCPSCQCNCNCQRVQYDGQFDNQRNPQRLASPQPRIDDGHGRQNQRGREPQQVNYNQYQHQNQEVGGYQPGYPG